MKYVCPCGKANNPVFDWGITRPVYANGSSQQVKITRHCCCSQPLLFSVCGSWSNLESTTYTNANHNQPCTENLTAQTSPSASAAPSNTHVWRSVTKGTGLVFGGCWKPPALSLPCPGGRSASPRSIPPPRRPNAAPVRIFPWCVRQPESIIHQRPLLIFQVACFSEAFA